jgi:hypothetical protein
MAAISTGSGRTDMLRKYALAATTIVTLAWSVGAPNAFASVGSPVREGDAAVVDGADGSHVLTHGQSATVFSLRLPAGAACPGDSANDQWRVQSFMVPAAIAAGAIHYNVAGPDGQDQYPLYMANTAQFVDSLTDPNAGPGQPGVIPAIPPLSLGAFPPGILPAGTYRIGIACTLSRQTAKYWDTEIVITSSPGDKPSQFVWRLLDVPESVNSSSHGSSRWLPPAIGGLLGVVAIGWFFLFRKPNSTTQSLKHRNFPTLSRSHNEPR